MWTLPWIVFNFENSVVMPTEKCENLNCPPSEPSSGQQALRSCELSRVPQLQGFHVGSDDGLAFLEGSDTRVREHSRLELLAGRVAFHVHFVCVNVRPGFPCQPLNR